MLKNMCVYIYHNQYAFTGDTK